MNKIIISFGEKDERENVFINFEGEDKKPLTFDTLKIMVKKLLDFKLSNKDYKYEIQPKNQNLDIYVSTIQEAFDSVLNDEDLYTLLKTEDKSVSHSINENKDV